MGSADSKHALICICLCDNTNAMIPTGRKVLTQNTVDEPDAFARVELQLTDTYEKNPSNIADILIHRLGRDCVWCGRLASTECKR